MGDRKRAVEDWNKRIEKWYNFLLNPYYNIFRKFSNSVERSVPNGKRKI